MSHYPNALTAYQNEDWAQAFACLQRGAAAGEADCYNLLAVCYEYGQGTVKNCHQAVRWYRRARYPHQRSRARACRPMAMPISGSLKTKCLALNIPAQAQRQPA